MVGELDKTIFDLQVDYNYTTKSRNGFIEIADPHLSSHFPHAHPLSSRQRQAIFSTPESYARDLFINYKFVNHNLCFLLVTPALASAGGRVGVSDHADQCHHRGTALLYQPREPVCLSAWAASGCERRNAVTITNA